MLKTQNASRILFLFLYKIRHSKTGRLSGELAFMLFFFTAFRTTYTSDFPTAEAIGYKL